MQTKDASVICNEPNYSRGWSQEGRHKVNRKNAVSIVGFWFSCWAEPWLGPHTPTCSCLPTSPCPPWPPSVTTHNQHGDFALGSCPSLHHHLEVTRISRFDEQNKRVKTNEFTTRCPFSREVSASQLTRLHIPVPFWAASLPPKLPTNTDQTPALAKMFNLSLMRVFIYKY